MPQITETSQKDRALQQSTEPETAAFPQNYTPEAKENIVQPEIEEDFDAAIALHFEASSDPKNTPRQIQDPLQKTLEHVERMQEIAHRLSTGEVTQAEYNELRTLLSQWKAKDGVLETFQKEVGAGRIELSAEDRKNLIGTLYDLTTRLSYAAGRTNIDLKHLTPEHLNPRLTKEQSLAKELNEMIRGPENDTRIVPDKGLRGDIEHIAARLYGKETWHSFETMMNKIASGIAPFEEIKDLRDKNPGLKNVFSEMLGRDLDTEVALLNPAYIDYVNSELTPVLTDEVRKMEAEVRSGTRPLGDIAKFRKEARKLTHGGELAAKFMDHSPKTSSEKNELTSQTLATLRQKVGVQAPQKNDLLSVAQFKAALREQLELQASGMEKRARHSPREIENFRQEASKLLQGQELDQTFPGGIKRDDFESQVLQWTMTVRRRAFQ